MKPLARCPSFRRLSRAASAGADARLQLHLAGCRACRQVMEDLEALTEAARRLPCDAPPPAALRELEATLLASAREFPPPAPLQWKLPLQVLGAGLAVASLALWILGPGAGTGHDAGSQLVASGDARYERSTLHPAQAGESSTERIQLAEGTIWLEVDSLGPNERFVVSTDDAEVEVRGTRFEVAARDGNLLRVSVQEGAVEVRHGGNTWLLHPGDLWEPAPALADEPPPARVTPAPAAEAPAAVAPPPRPSPAPVAHASVAPQPPPPELPDPEPAPVQLAMLDATPPRGERAFSAGWTALRSGDPAAAAIHFGEVSRLGADPGLLVDAAYWRIVALARSGAEADAEREMEAFLRKHAGSEREGEVALMLGLRRMRAGALPDARRLLEQAAQTTGEPLRSRANTALLQLGE